MRFIDYSATVTGLNASTNFRAFDIKHLTGYSISGKITSASSLDMTFKVQGSNNAFLNNVNNNEDSNAIWEDVPGSTANFTTNSTFMFNTEAAYYSAFRLVVTRTAGSCTLEWHAFAKGKI